MPSGTKAHANFFAWLATEPHFFVSFGFLGGLENANWASKGPQGLQKGIPKSPKIDQKSTRAPLGIPGGVRGYPPGASEPPKMQIYAYLCIFMHIFTVFCAYLCILMRVFISFVHIYACCCTRHPYLCIFMCFYAYSGIFMNLYLYLMRICTHLCSLCIPVHIYTYLFTRRR